MKNIYFMSVLAMALFVSNTQAGAQDLVSSSFVRSYSATEIGTSFPVGGLAKYNVEVYKLLYTTKGVHGQKDTVSGLVVYPVLAHTSWPVLVYQHGTASSRDGVPSRMSAEAAIGSIGGSLGYVSILPDYLGLGDSDGFHPYVHAKTEASVAVDMLYALQQFAAKQQVYLNGQIFMTGYSQGGHASMALHRALETEFSDKFKVVAAAHMSGPYSISGDTRLRLLSNDEYFFPGYALYTMLSYNMAYNLYPTLKHFIREPYLQIAEDFFSGKEERLDSVHVKLARVLMQEKGKVIPRYIFQDSVLAAIATQPQHPVNLAMRDNDVYEWAPKAPTRLFYCKADDQVVYTNSLLADSTMKAKGAVNVGAVDVGSSYNHGQCFQPALLSSVFFFSFFQNVQTDLLAQLPELPIRMFPNPASDWCMLDNVPVGSMITLTDLSGRELRSMQAQESATEIPLEGIQSGLYMVRVRARTGTWTGKLIVR